MINSGASISLLAEAQAANRNLRKKNTQASAITSTLSLNNYYEVKMG